MDGSDGMYAVKLTSFGALEFLANENTLGNDCVDNNFNYVKHLENYNDLKNMWLTIGQG